jgi:ATP-dependent DNA ligase
MSFEALQRRAASSGRTAARLAQETPAHFVAFDLLQADGQEPLHVPYGERRARLEWLFTDRGLFRGRCAWRRATWRRPRKG